MKKNIVKNLKAIALMLSFSATLLPWISASGPLQLEDKCDQYGSVVERGLIMKKIFTDQRLHGQLCTLVQFENVTSKDCLGSYQQIMDKLSSIEANSGTNAAVVDQLVELFEHAIMYCYDDCIYVFGGYTKYLSIGFSGLRWRALNPFSYLNPFSWLSENHEKGSQLICEFDQLVNLYSKIGSSKLMKNRLNSTLFAYQHWFKVRGLAYLSLILFTGKDSTVYWNGFRLEDKHGRNVRILSKKYILNID